MSLRTVAKTIHGVALDDLYLGNDAAIGVALTLIRDKVAERVEYYLCILSVVWLHNVGVAADDNVDTLTMQ